MKKLVSQPKSRIPILKKGYSLNDRVGTSYLEKQYEETLQGKRSVKEIHLDKYGQHGECRKYRRWYQREQY